MIHYKTHPKKALFEDQKEQEIFLNLFNDTDEDIYKTIAKLSFCDGETCEQTAEITNYSKRQIERIRVFLLKIALKRAIKKQIPKKPTPMDKGRTETIGNQKNS